ncbi:MAG: mechanosensitive ion channel family protein [Halobacteriovoraceae bacterium]|nr:mechanosensitive ion channel family protein [Halobacteriovoraceae bacterium]
MDQLLEWFKEHLMVRQTMINIILVIALFFLRHFLFEYSKNSKSLNTNQKRRLDVNIQTFITICMLVGTILIWAEELRTVALSIIAVAAAFVIATKELIQCFTGTIYKASQDPFSLGDRIEIDGIRGDVINRGLLSTKILEIGPGDKSHQYTGRSITLPNSIFLNKEIINESFLQNYVLHIFEVTVSLKDEWHEAEKILVEEAIKATQEYYPKASRTIESYLSKRHLEVPQLTPRVHLRPLDGDKVSLMIRISVPARTKGRIEQEIIRNYLTRFYKK